MLIPSATFATEYWQALKYVVGTYVRNGLVARGKNWILNTIIRCSSRKTALYFNFSFDISTETLSKKKLIKIIAIKSFQWKLALEAVEKSVKRFFFCFLFALEVFWKGTKTKFKTISKRANYFSRLCQKLSSSVQPNQKP